MTPVVSVVMSVFNGLPDLDMAIWSLRTQSLKDVEFIVIDDGSSDGSQDVLRNWAAEDNRVRLIEQENAGLTKALIRGASLARGEFIARQDADDQSTGMRFADQVAALRADPRAVAVTCGLDMMRGQRSVGCYMPKGDADTLPWQLAFHNVVAGHGQFMFRRDAYEAAGGYSADFYCAQDFDLWNRLKRYGPILILPQTLYRYGMGSTSALTSRFGKLQSDLAVSVVQRELSLLAGRAISLTEANEARNFWHETPPGSLSERALDRVDKIMRQTVRAYLRLNRALGRNPAPLRSLIANRWILRARAQWRSDPIAATDAMVRAASWHLPSALAEPRRIVSARFDKMFAEA